MKVSSSTDRARRGRCAIGGALLSLLLVATGCAGAFPGEDTPRSGSAASGGEEAPPELDEEEERKLDREVRSIREEAGGEGKGDSIGFGFYRSTYRNMVVAGETSDGPIALIAGSHEADFPFWGDRPWDNGLLYIDGEGYHFTHRELGRALELDIETGEEESTGHIRYSGAMERASDGRRVQVRLSIPVAVTQQPKYQLGRPYAFLGGKAAERFAGMRWRPYKLESGRGSVEVAGEPMRAIDELHGEIEHGELVNMKHDRFAFAYDYVSLAAPGSDGYSFIDFKAEPLDPSGILGYMLGAYMERFASATMTLGAEHRSGNVHGVDRPAQSEESVVLFENSVDLELATLRRQMIKTTDRQGRVLYGLREIFEPK